MAETAKKMNIYEAISRCMEEIGAVGKNDVNKSQGFKYRGIDAVMNAINPALVNNHIFIVPEVLEQTREERKTPKGATLIYSVCKIKYPFFAEDGSSITAETIGEWTAEIRLRIRQWRSLLNMLVFKCSVFLPKRCRIQIQKAIR